MLRIIYTFALLIFTPSVLLRMLWRSRKNVGYRQNWGERFGFVPFSTKKTIWIHAVSLGESIAAMPLIEELIKQYSEYQIVITNTTPTGRQAIEKRFGNRVLNSYLPYDLPWALKCFIKRINPSVLILMETELWPNCLHVCQKMNVPVILANARLSDRSCRGYQRFSWLTKPMVNCLSLIAAQYQRDADNFKQLGIDKNKIVLTGNIKFDMTINKSITDGGNALRNKVLDKAKVWIAASTHPGEDQIMLKAHQQLLTKFPEALLILVPRHQDRFESVTELAQKQFNTITRSSKKQCEAKTQVYVGDTMGELLTLYQSADIAFVGGSLSIGGGHNIVEPALLGKPVITGPGMKNFKTIARLFDREQARFVINDEGQLADQLVALFENPQEHRRLGDKAQQVAKKNQGALKALMNQIEPFIKD